MYHREPLLMIRISSYNSYRHSWRSCNRSPITSPSCIFTHFSFASVLVFTVISFCDLALFDLSIVFLSSLLLTLHRYLEHHRSTQVSNSVCLSCVCVSFSCTVSRTHSLSSSLSRTSSFHSALIQVPLAFHSHLSPPPSLFALVTLVALVASY